MLSNPNNFDHTQIYSNLLDIQKPPIFDIFWMVYNEKNRNSLTSMERRRLRDLIDIIFVP